jgi:hypothetical protein
MSDPTAVTIMLASADAIDVMVFSAGSVTKTVFDPAARLNFAPPLDELIIVSLLSVLAEYVPSPTSHCVSPWIV